jgi:hypothetical protein
MDRLLRRLAFVVIAALTGAIGALLIEASLTTRPDKPFGHSEAGHVVGWLALLAVLLVMAYSWVKRVARLQKWRQAAFRLHMLAGVGAPALALVHAGMHLHALVPVFTTLTMLAISLSGVIGKTVHFFAVRSLHAERRQLAATGLTAEAIKERLGSLAASAKAFRIWQYLHAPATIIFLAALGAHVFGALYFGGP